MRGALYFWRRRLPWDWWMLQDLCMKPCGNHGSCLFASDDTAFCDCDFGWSGEFCGTRVDVSSKRIQGSEIPAASGETFACDLTTKSVKQFCDGHLDCEDRTDESNCTLADYRRVRPNGHERFLCLKPCRWGTCIFDRTPSKLTREALCICDENAEGVFCELSSLTSSDQTPTYAARTAGDMTKLSPEKLQEDSTDESSYSVKIIAFPVLFVSGIILILWLVV